MLIGMMNDPFKKLSRKHILTQLGIFYLLIISLMVIPLLATFVVVLIKGIIDMQYVIIVGGGLLAAAFVFWLIKAAIRFIRRLRSNNDQMEDHIHKKMDAGDAVEVSVLGGLFKIQYKGKKSLEGQSPDIGYKSPLMLTHTTSDGTIDVVAQLQTLSALKNAGEIDEAEYNTIKNQLIYSGSEPPPLRAISK